MIYEDLWGPIVHSIANCLVQGRQQIVEKTPRQSLLELVSLKQDFVQFLFLVYKIDLPSYCFETSVGIVADGTTVQNQSRICGKGVGLSLFPSDSLSFESYEQFLRKSKKVEKWLFFGHFWDNFGYVSHIPVIQF